VARENVGILFAMTLLVTAVVGSPTGHCSTRRSTRVGGRANGLHVGRYNLLLVVLTAVVVAAMQIWT